MIYLQHSKTAKRLLHEREAEILHCITEGQQKKHTSNQKNNSVVKKRRSTVGLKCVNFSEMLLAVCY